MKGDTLALRWACPRCEKSFGTQNGKWIHLTLVHKQEIHEDVMAGRAELERNRARLRPLNLQAAEPEVLEAVLTVLTEGIADNNHLHVTEERVAPLIHALRFTLGREA